MESLGESPPPRRRRASFARLEGNRWSSSHFQRTVRNIRYRRWLSVEAEPWEQAPAARPLDGNRVRLEPRFPRTLSLRVHQLGQDNPGSDPPRPALGSHRVPEPVAERGHPEGADAGGRSRWTAGLASEYYISPQYHSRPHASAHHRAERADIPHRSRRNGDAGLPHRAGPDVRRHVRQSHGSDARATVRGSGEESPFRSGPDVEL